MRSQEIDLPREHPGGPSVDGTMDADPRGYEEEDRWVSFAAHLDPPAAARARRRPRNKEARRALVLAILGVICFGFVLGPLALGLGQRARLALVSEPSHEDTGVAHAAVMMGKVGLALHLTIVMAILPWLLFMLPRLADAGW